MSFEDERRAFEYRVSQNFSAAPVKYPGVPLDVTGDAYVRMQLLPSAAKRVSLGNNGRFRYWGLLVFEIFTRADKGSKAAKVLADQLSAIFKEASFNRGTSGYILCGVPHIDDLGAREDGWYQLNLITEYRRDEQ